MRITDIDDESRIFLSDNLSSPEIDGEIDPHYQLNKGEIVFARTGASVGKTFLNRDNNDNIYFAGFLIRVSINDDADPEFIYQNTLTEGYGRFVELTSQRSGQPGINAQEYKTFEFAAPAIEEQRRIGNFFSRLDNLITLHQRKCKTVKEDEERCIFRKIHY